MKNTEENPKQWISKSLEVCESNGVSKTIIQAFIKGEGIYDNR